MASRWGIELWDQKALIERTVDDGIAFVDKVCGVCVSLSVEDT